jgi:hypothetical protein
MNWRTFAVLNFPTSAANWISRSTRIFRRPATRSRKHCRNFANQKVVKNSLSFSTATNPRPKFRQGNGLNVTAYIPDEISGLNRCLAPRRANWNWQVNGRSCEPESDKHCWSSSSAGGYWPAPIIRDDMFSTNISLKLAFRRWRRYN